MMNRIWGLKGISLTWYQLLDKHPFVCMYEWCVYKMTDSNTHPASNIEEAVRELFFSSFCQCSFFRRQWSVPRMRFCENWTKAFGDSWDRHGVVDSQCSHRSMPWKSPFCNALVVHVCRSQDGDMMYGVIQLKYIASNASYPCLPVWVFTLVSCLLQIPAGNAFYVRDSLMDLLTPGFKWGNIPTGEIMLCMIVVVTCGESAVRCQMVTSEAEIRVDIFPLGSSKSCESHILCPDILGCVAFTWWCTGDKDLVDLCSFWSQR